MITHKTNFDALLMADNCTFPNVNIKMNTYDTDDGVRCYIFLCTKVTVKGRNGEKYFIPVIDKHTNIDKSHIYEVLERFNDTCATVRDYYITTEGKDVLVEDYKKVIDFNKK